MLLYSFFPLVLLLLELPEGVINVALCATLMVQLSSKQLDNLMKIDFETILSCVTVILISKSFFNCQIVFEYSCASSFTPSQLHAPQLQ